MRLLLTISLMFFCACKDNKPVKKSPLLPTQTQAYVSVTNYPLKWICESLLESSSLVYYPIPSDIDPAFWTPTNETLQKMLAGKKIITNGATYEKWLETTSLPLSRLFDSTIDKKSDYVIIKDAIKHEHDGHVHSHDGTAFTTWLQEEFMVQQITTVSKELQSLYPAIKDQIVSQEKVLIKQVNELHALMKDSFKSQKKFLASHPIYQYLAKDQDLDIVDFEWEPDAIPSAKQWQEFEAKKSHSTYMLWEDNPNMETAEKLKSLGIKVIVFRQCGNIPPSNDYIKEMKNNLTNVDTALK